jgi:hypothetical protein
MHACRTLRGQDLSMMLEPGVVLSIALLVLLYMAMLPISAYAWGCLLQGLGRNAPFALTAPILATSQFGKYLPGNAAHHIGRLVMARSAGIGAGGGILSIAYESILSVLACAHASALTFLWDTPKAFSDSIVTDNRVLLITLVTAGAIATLMLAPHLAQIVWRLRNRHTPEAQPPSLSPGAAAMAIGYLCYAANFALVGFGLWVVASVLVPGTGISPILLTGAFASSWLIGFVTPGAPAGLGVREAVLTLWLSESLPAGTVVVLVLALRIATTLGDLLSLAWGSLVLRLRHPSVGSSEP